MILNKNVQLISLPKILDDRGNLSFVEQTAHVPFEIKRVYWIYDVPGGGIRGGHSYKENKELIIALSGSFTVLVNNGIENQEFHLNRSYNGLYVPNKVWRHMENFSTNSLAMVISSTIYNANDYQRDFAQFLKERSNEKPINI